MSEHIETAEASQDGGTARRLSRRERVREATLEEIKQIARRLLVAHGLPGVSLRAIAREMGMTAPGLYRYFASLDDLLSALQQEFFDELTAAVTAAIEEGGAGDVDGHVCAALRAFRLWGKRYPAEFTLLFGPPAGRAGNCLHEEHHDAGARFGAVFFDLFVRVWQEQRFSPPPEESIPPELKEQLRAFAAELGAGEEREIPIGAVRILVSAWVRIYGLICMEIFGQLHYMIDDMEPLFEAELRDVLSTAGIEYRPPSE